MARLYATRHAHPEGCGYIYIDGRRPALGLWKEQEQIEVKRIGLALIRLYQLTISRILPASCRFEPSCSHYGYEAIDRYGLLKGGWMALKRITRCHPFHPGGYDPVP